MDRIDERGRPVATEVPASIFYHLVTALMQYLDKTAGQVEPFPARVPEKDAAQANRAYA